MISNILDILRILFVAAAFFFGYQIGFAEGYDPVVQLHFMIPVLIFAVAGISGLEGLFFGKKAAEAKGYEVGSNYQRQSAIALLSYAVVALLIYFINWGVKAELTIFFAFCFFFFFSGLNHAINAIKYKNFKWQNINRPFITLLMIAGMLYPVIKALRII
jgi:hypothetical protein